MLSTTFKVAALIWVGLLLTGTALLAALYLFEAAARAMRRKLLRRQ